MHGPADELPNLGGRTVLIAESNPLIALDLAETIRVWGGQPLHLGDLTAAEQSEAPGQVCAALVDMTQSHLQLAQLVDDLRRRKVPIVLTTAWQLDDIGDQFPGMTIFEKPVNYAALADWFAEVARLGSSSQRCRQG